MPIIQCPILGCTYETDDVDVSIAAVLLTIHNNIHTANSAKSTINFPTISKGCDEIMWDEFKMRWDFYKQQCNLNSEEIVKHLFQCCDEDLQNDIMKEFPKGFIGTEEELLLNITRFAITSNAVRRVQLVSLKQNHGESARNFHRRIEKIASTCDYSIECSCTQRLNITSVIIKDVFIAGLTNDNIKKKVLAWKELGSKGINDIICFIEGVEQANGFLPKNKTKDSLNAIKLTEKTNDSGLINSTHASSINRSEEVGSAIKDSEQVGFSINASKQVGLAIKDSKKAGSAINNSKQVVSTINDSEQVGSAIKNSEQVGSPINDSKQVGSTINNSKQVGSPINESGQAGSVVNKTENVGTFSDTEIHDSVSDSSLTNDLIRSDKSVQTVKKQFKHKCNLCDREFANKYGFALHMKDFHEINPYKCTLCDKSFVKKRLLLEHIEEGHIKNGESRYKCEVCSKSFSNTYRLNRHSRTHSGVKPYICGVCNKGFTQKGDLTIHERRHKGEKPYNCHVCSKAFSSSSSLNTHSRVHSGVKPYKCDLCNRGFAYSSSLKDHLRVHSGEKPYNCHVCDQSFAKKSNLRAHSEIHSIE